MYKALATTRRSFWCSIVRWMPLWLVALTSMVGCTRPIAVRGLRPEYPEALLNGASQKASFVKVDSLRPTLRWEPFPRPEDHKAGREGLVSGIGDVTYDLKIWEAYEEGPVEYPAELVYSRRELREPWHKLEEPLKPSTKYFWTIRARFELHGQARVTEWGVTGVWVPPFAALAGHREERDDARRWSEPLLGRLDVVPNPLHYRFKTPSEREDGIHKEWTGTKTEEQQGQFIGHGYSPSPFE